MDLSDCEIPSRSLNTPAAHHHLPPYSDAHTPDSLFERCSWFYALCREYLFRDHTQEIALSLFPTEGPRPGTTVLELGCGPGFYSCRLAQDYPNVHTAGVDLSRNLIKRAKSRAARRRLGNCTFTHGDAQSLPHATSSVHAIIVSRLFLIVPGKEAVLSEIHRLLRPGGRCFIAEPTSGFRTRIPLSCMWLLSKLTSSPAGKYREPHQADVLSRPSFATLIHSQPWQTVDLQYDGWYQYAVCTKSTVQPVRVESGPTAESSQLRSAHAVPAPPDPLKQLHQSNTWSTV